MPKRVMEIFLFEIEPSTDLGGQERSLFDVARGLANRGHHVNLLHLKDGNMLEGYKTFCKRIIRLGGYTINRGMFFSSLFRFFKDAMSFPAPNNGVLYMNQYHDTLFGALVSLLRHLPLVCHFRLDPPKESCVQWKLGLRGVRHFISNSYHTRDAWIRRGIKPSKVDVVYNGIDTSLFLPHIRENSIHREWGIAEDERVLTFCGRLDIGKGIETLMRSFSEIKPKENRTRLLIAGKPLNHATYQAGQAYLKSLKQLSQQLGIHSEVTFLGHIRDTVELFQISDLVVLPSDLPESFGRTIIESMSCAVPALASDQGGTREILTGEFKKHLFPPRDSRGLARLLRQKINWRVTEPGLGDRCRRHVIDHFGLEHMIDGIESVLQKIIIKKQNQ